VIITVVAAVIRAGTNILITRRFSDVHLPGYWEFPGGKVEPGESLKIALQREIREELGVEIKVEDEFFTVDHVYPERTVRLHFFNCRIVAGEPQLLDVADMRWVEPHELSSFEFPPADLELIKRLRGD